ncbi:unannotated protein [freshwater metagenome]|uniref:Unannotated protein n=1 Tax=freshwater metagenome TaxID=449393 RepID=A0A6J7BSP8_9ZZZZ
MARVNITIPDELVDEARKQGLNVSRLASGAVAFELDRLRKIAMLDVYLAEMEAELGPIRAEERAEAKEWVDRLLKGAPAEKQASA